MRRNPRRADVNPSAPRAWGTSDRNGMISNHHKLQWQQQWRGSRIMNTGILVGDDELDIPQRQLGILILPPDPRPIMNARPEQYTIDEQQQRVTQSGQIRYQMDGTIRIQSNVQS